MTQTSQEYRVTRPWRPQDTNLVWEKMIFWCIENFGLPGKRWNSATSMHETEFIFYDIADASLFSLKWS